mgnify:CR=1 FL=1
MGLDSRQAIRSDRDIASTNAADAIRQSIERALSSSSWLKQISSRVTRLANIAITCAHPIHQFTAVELVKKHHDGMSKTGKILILIFPPCNKHSTNRPAESLNPHRAHAEGTKEMRDRKPERVQALIARRPRSPMCRGSDASRAAKTRNRNVPPFIHLHHFPGANAA